MAACKVGLHPKHWDNFGWMPLLSSLMKSNKPVSCNWQFFFKSPSHGSSSLNPTEQVASAMLLATHCHCWTFTPGLGKPVKVLLFHQLMCHNLMWPPITAHSGLQAVCYVWVWMVRIWISFVSPSQLLLQAFIWDIPGELAPELSST